MNDKDVRAVASDWLVLGSEALLTGLSTLAVVGALLFAIA